MPTPVTPRQHLRLTSAVEATDPTEPTVTPPQLRRALWLQERSLRALSLVARDIPTRDNQIRNQEALCAELQRITTEAHNLLRELEAAEVA